MDTLQVVPISLANADQQWSSGRTGAGIAYRLYTEKPLNPTVCMYNRS